MGYKLFALRNNVRLLKFINVFWTLLSKREANTFRQHSNNKYSLRSKIEILILKKIDSTQVFRTKHFERF